MTEFAQAPSYHRHGTGKCTGNLRFKATDFYNSYQTAPNLNKTKFERNCIETIVHHKKIEPVEKQNIEQIGMLKRNTTNSINGKL